MIREDTLFQVQCTVFLKYKQPSALCLTVNITIVILN